MKHIPGVIVVDDDPNMRKSLDDILRLKGFDVVVAASGTEGSRQQSIALSTWHWLTSSYRMFRGSR